MYDRTLEGNGGPMKLWRSIKNIIKGFLGVQKVAIKKEQQKKKQKSHAEMIQRWWR